MRIDVNGKMVTAAWYNSGVIYQGVSVCEEQIKDIVLSSWGVDDDSNQCHLQV